MVITLTVISVFLFYGIKLFINSILYDFKDINGDIAAGIRTLPALIGEKNTRKLLMTLCLLLHVCIAGAFMMNIIRTEPVIISYGLIAGMICISFDSSRVNDDPGIRRYFREILVDGEARPL